MGEEDVDRGEVEASKMPGRESGISDRPIHAAAGMLIISQRLQDRHPKPRLILPRGETCNVNFPTFNNMNE